MVRLPPLVLSGSAWYPPRMSVTLAQSRYRSGGPDLPTRRKPYGRKTIAYGASFSDSGPKIKALVPDWDDKAVYTDSELLMHAEKILICDPKPPGEDPAYLPIATLKDRRKREIYNINGVPDPSICSGLYWRSHPGGRKLWSPEERKENDSRGFYR